MKLLAQREVLATYPADGGSTVFALRPRTIMVHSLATDPSSPDDDGGSDPADGTGVNDYGVRCTWRQTVPPGRPDDWLGTPCLRFQCGGRFTTDDRDYSDDYYRRLYTVDRPGDVLTAEHTGALSRTRREEVEQAFKNRPSPFDPNVLTCTPTLELGIDIGDLSAVLLASLPPAPANYAQRIGRAGRSTGNSLTVTLYRAAPATSTTCTHPRRCSRAGSSRRTATWTPPRSCAASTWRSCWTGPPTAVCGGGR